MAFEKGKVRCFLVSFFGFAEKKKKELKDGRARPFKLTEKFAFGWLMGSGLMVEKEGESEWFPVFEVFFLFEFVVGFKGGQFWV